MSAFLLRQSGLLAGFYRAICQSIDYVTIPDGMFSHQVPAQQASQTSASDHKSVPRKLTPLQKVQATTDQGYMALNGIALLADGGPELVALVGDQSTKKGAQFFSKFTPAQIKTKDAVAAFGMAGGVQFFATHAPRVANQEGRIEFPVTAAL